MPLPSILGPFVDIPAVPAAQLTASPPTAAERSSKILSFTMQGQKQTEWCWAATAASISVFYRDNPALSQCEVATRCIGIDCCVTPLPPDGNRTWALENALYRINHLASGPTEPLMFQEIKDEIDQGRPVCCRISWGHFNAIVGYYDDGHQDIVVRDSLYPGDHTLPYELFVSPNGYHGGYWQNSYLTARVGNAD